jgi:hypothetical protein
MNLDMYDDMMGLEFGEYEGLDGLMNVEQLKSAFVAASAGGLAILAATKGVKKLSDMVGLESKVQNPVLRSAIVSGATLVAGVAVGNMAFRYNERAALGIVSGLGGIAMASFFDTLLSTYAGQARSLPALGEAGVDYSDDGMSALAALEATNVQSAPGAFGGPVVTPEKLMGLEAAVVSTDTLGNYFEGYNAYLS